VNDNLKDDNDICLMTHNKRNCLFDEANFCIKNNIGDKKLIKKQIEDYLNDNMIYNYGLYAPGIMIRRNNDNVKKFMEL
jgi:hypothetical protein